MEDLYPDSRLIFGYFFKIMNLKEELNKSSMMALHRSSMVILIILILYITVSLRIAGQSYQHYTLNHEMVYVHLDKLVYVAGESMRYKVYAVDAATPGKKPCSKILYFTLTGTENKNVLNWRINLQDKRVSGYFTIPADIKSGTYVLNVYTNWMRNGSADSLYTQNLLIMNLSESIPNTLLYFSPGDTAIVYPATSDHNGFALNLRTSKSYYSVNENVRLEIKLESENRNTTGADLSISVSAETPFKELLKEKDIVSCLHTYTEPDDKSSISDNHAEYTGLIKEEINKVPCSYRMEDKGFILTGWIKSRKDNSPLTDGKILLSVIDSISPRILYSRIDSAGEFLFYLSNMYDNNELILQLAGQSKTADYYWELDKKIVNANLRAYSPYLLKSDEIAFLNTVKNIRLIDAVYANQPVRNQQEADITGANYFSPPKVVIYLREYADMVNFKEIADNIIREVKFSVRNNGFYLQVLDTRSAMWKENNIVLLNGVPFTDLAYISTLGTKSIKRIEVITSDFFIGDLTFPGLVSIYTYDNKVPGIYLKNNTFSYKNFVITDGTVGETDAEKIAGVSGGHYPDFRNTLYWKSDATITNNSNLVVEFPASRLTGIFTINVQGLTAEGFPVSATASFEVKE
jgi:hypothetical protein